MLKFNEGGIAINQCRFRTEVRRAGGPWKKIAFSNSFCELIEEIWLFHSTYTMLSSLLDW